MKRALEAVLVLAALALGAYVVRQGVARRELAAHPPAANPALAPGTDPGNPAAPIRRGATSLPRIKLFRPPKAFKRSAAVPPPAVSTP